MDGLLCNDYLDYTPANSNIIHLFLLVRQATTMNTSKERHPETPFQKSKGAVFKYHYHS